jgi:hypothetical protein
VHFATRNNLTVAQQWPFIFSVVSFGLLEFFAHAAPFVTLNTQAIYNESRERAQNKTGKEASKCGNVFHVAKHYQPSKWPRIDFSRKQRQRFSINSSSKSTALCRQQISAYNFM